MSEVSAAVETDIESVLTRDQAETRFGSDEQNGKLIAGVLNETSSTAVFDDSAPASESAAAASDAAASDAPTTNNNNNNPLANDTFLRRSIRRISNKLHPAPKRKDPMQRRFAREIYEQKLEAHRKEMAALKGDGTGGGQNLFNADQMALARGCCGRFRDTMRDALDTLMPLRCVVKSVEKQFGTANASFFEFVRFLFYLNLFILLIFVLFIFLPHFSFKTSSTTTMTAATTESSTMTPATGEVTTESSKMMPAATNATAETFTTMTATTKVTTDTFTTTLAATTAETAETFTTWPTAINATTESSTIMAADTNVTSRGSRSMPDATNVPAETDANVTSKTPSAFERTASSVSRQETVATCSLEYLHKVQNDSQYAKIEVSNNMSTGELNKMFEDASRPVIDFLQGTGFFEMTFLFYGNYSPVEGNSSAMGDLGIALQDYNMPAAYILVTFAWMIVWLLAMIHNTASGIKQKMLANAENTAYSCCVLVFASWDFCIANVAMRRAKQGEVRQLLNVEIHEKQRIAREKEMTKRQRCRRTAIRVATHLVVLALLGGSFAGIYFAVRYSLNNRNPEQARLSNPLREDQLTFWVLVVNYLPTIAMAAVNMVVPILMDQIARLEQWEPMKELSTKLMRLVFIKLLSLVALILSLYEEITCNLEDPKNDCGVCLRDEEDQEAGDLLCWETKVGQQFWRITVLNLLTLLITCFCVEFPRHLLAKYCCRGKETVDDDDDDDAAANEDHVVEEAGDGDDADDDDVDAGNRVVRIDVAGDGSGEVEAGSSYDVQAATSREQQRQQQPRRRRKKSGVAEVKRDGRFRQILGNVQFVLERNVLDLVYVQTVFWLSFFFVPLMSAISCFVLFCYFFIYLFKLKVNSRLSDESAFKAAGVNSLFMTALLLSFFFVIIVILFFIISIPPSRACGPFRNHDSMTAPLTLGIEALDKPFDGIIRIIFSHGVLIGIVIFTVIGVYYYKSVVQAHQVLVGILRNQLDDEKAKARGNESERKAKSTDFRVSYLTDRE